MLFETFKVPAPRSFVMVVGLKGRLPDACVPAYMYSGYELLPV